MDSDVVSVGSSHPLIGSDSSDSTSSMESLAAPPIRHNYSLIYSVTDMPMFMRLRPGAMHNRVVCCELHSQWNDPHLTHIIRWICPECDADIPRGGRHWYLKPVDKWSDGSCVRIGCSCGNRSRVTVVEPLNHGTITRENKSLAVMTVAVEGELLLDVGAPCYMHDRDKHLFELICDIPNMHLEVETSPMINLSSEDGVNDYTVEVMGHMHKVSGFSGKWVETF